MAGWHSRQGTVSNCMEVQLSGHGKQWWLVSAKHGDGHDCMGGHRRMLRSIRR